MDVIGTAKSLGQAFLDGFLFPGRQIVSFLQSVFPETPLLEAASASLGFDPLPLLVSLIVWALLLLLLQRIGERLTRMLATVDDHISALRLRLRLLGVRLSHPVQGLLKWWHAWHNGESLSSEAVELDKMDIAVLRIAQERSPTLAISAPDLVEHLHARPATIQRRLDRLSSYQLIKNAVGSTGGFTHYTITRAGALFARGQ